MSNSRRGRGEGTIHQEPDGSWSGRVDLGKNDLGKRVRRKVRGSTRSEVASKMQAIRTAHAAGIDQATRAPTVAAVATEWLTTVAPRRKAVSTLSRVSATTQRHIIRGLGHHRVDTLRPEHVEAWLQAEADQGAARRTLDGYRGTLREILNWCLRRRLVTWNVATIADLPMNARGPVEKRTLTADQARLLLAGMADHRLGAYFSTIMLLGLRPGEADALAWDDVDLAAGSVVIHRAMQRIDGGRPVAIGPTKTKQARVLALPAHLVDLLRQHRVSQATERLAAGRYWSQDWPGLVFTSEAGTPMHPSNCRRAFTALCEQAHVPTVTPYELRHTAASLLIDAGVPPYEVADQLGHTDLRMIERHYRHRLHPTVTAGAAAMDHLLAGQTLGSQEWPQDSDALPGTGTAGL